MNPHRQPHIIRTRKQDPAACSVEEKRENNVQEVGTGDGDGIHAAAPAAVEAQHRQIEHNVPVALLLSARTMSNSPRNAYPQPVLWKKHNNNQGENGVVEQLVEAMTQPGSRQQKHQRHEGLRVTRS